jgi:hypothetical protein
VDANRMATASVAGPRPISRSGHESETVSARPKALMVIGCFA